MSEFNFGPAREGEQMVFGAQRPGYGSEHVGLEEVEGWVSFMKQQGIEGVCCLLSQEELDYYEINLLDLYCREFGKANVCWAPVGDCCICSLAEFKEKILPFLEGACTNNKKVVMHCSAGCGRTGHVLAAWLVHGRGLSKEEALEAVQSVGGVYRNPCEALFLENDAKEDLHALLKKS
ncbi:dual specificity protein phosphatase family protein [Thermatribacter velox]|jgi:protein-tyrosine phosphatase|uniref:Dual specificity protein phosphatase family protein n=1 Tax=Thermatribacter velox TaxID=3039681 RepID=A0ABZ2Y925_9BACT